MVSPSTWTSVLPSLHSSLDNLRKHNHAIGFSEVLALGITIVIGGQFYGWNAAGLHHGFENVVIAFFLVAAGYLTLSFCMAEMASFFPFGGGSFGYTRCIIHPFVGYLVGVAEVVEYILYVAASVNQLGIFLTMIFGTSSDLEPLWWALFLGISVPIQCYGGGLLWTVFKLLAILPVVIVLLYFFSALPSVDIAQHADFRGNDNDTLQGAFYFVQGFPIMSWLFVGIEGMILASEEAPRAATVVPRAVMCCWLILFATGIIIIFTSNSLGPGTVQLQNEMAVLNPGFMSVFDAHSSLATMLTLPGALGTSFGFLYAGGKLLAAMAQSRVLPPVLGTHSGPFHTPSLSIATVAACAFAVLLLVRFAISEHATVMFDLCMMNSAFVYIALAYSYWICVDRYSNLTRYFISPLGVGGAAYCGLIFTFLMVSLCFFQETYAVMIIFFCQIIVAMGYYVKVAKKREYFSEEEVNKFMKAYVINANLRRKQSIQKASKKRMMQKLKTNAVSPMGKQGTNEKKLASLEAVEVVRSPSAQRRISSVGELLPVAFLPEQLIERISQEGEMIGDSTARVGTTFTVARSQGAASESTLRASAFTPAPGVLESQPNLPLQGDKAVDVVAQAVEVAPPAPLSSLPDI